MGHIDKNEVLRYLGYGGQDVADELDERIDQAISLCRQTCTPRHTWRAFKLDPYEEGRPRTVAGTTLSLAGTSMGRYAAGAVGVALLACTLGASCERQLRLLASNDPLGQLLYDAACSALVESEADACNDEVIAWAKSKDLTCGSRYSPGYGDFTLEIQSSLLTVLNAPSILGIHATDDGLLIPTKSITAVIGIYKDEVPPTSLDCIACNLFETCSFRRRGISCHHGI